VSGATGTGEPSDCWYHRQPEGEECRKRGRALDPSGFDAGKGIKGKKRHLLVDTWGLVMHAIVHAANLQERDGGILLLSTLGERFPLLAKLVADGAYQGPLFGKALAKVLPQLTLEVVTRSD
jgi:putative transposase